MKKKIRAGIEVLFLLAVFIFVMDCSQDKTPTQPGDVNPASSLEQQTHELINAVRKGQGLQALAWNDAIAGEAKIHSLNMAAGAVSVGHDGFDARAEAIGKKVAWVSIGENVAYNQGYADPVAKAVEGWMKSDGHRHNILGDFNLTGIGVAINDQGEYFFTQIFAQSE